MMIRTPLTAATLMLGASTIALAHPAMATETLFASHEIEVREGARINQQEGLTQIRLTDGAIASFIDAADFRINADSTIDLYAGGVTIAAGADGSETVVRMPEGVEGRIAGAGAAASFSVGPDGKARGHALGGAARIGRAGAFRTFEAGEMFAVSDNGNIRQVVSNGAQSTPDVASPVQTASAPVMAMGGDAGPVAAAQNGLPVSLGDALTAAGASGDILSAARSVEAAAANPTIETFPSGDLALLVTAAADLEGVYGGSPFPQAQADIIRTYLRFLAGGGSGADFLTSYSGFLVQYFGLIRAEGSPSGFALANVADIDAFAAYLSRTRGFAEFSAQDRVLANAYLAFIANGGNADRFAASFTDLTQAYFAFLREGGLPQNFAAASLATVEEYIAFLNASGLAGRLAASDRALLDAYLANGGFGFVGEYRAALDAYFAFLASGQRPSDYDGADVGVLLGYVQTLQAAGLLNTALGDNARFFADFSAFVKGGGQVDAFAQLNANIFAGYADALRAYFAFLDSGGVPSGYTVADVELLNTYLAQLAAAGALDRFLGDRSAFFADYLAFLQGGGAIDTYAQLNANIFASYADALAAYYAYLENGGIPSAYAVLDQDTIQAYLAALARVGATDGFLADLAAFYSDYFAFVTGGGNPDNFAGLPVPPDFPAFASALNAYAAFLSGGGLPSDYDAVDFALLQNYLEAIVASGQLADLLGSNADLLTSYFTYLGTGGTLDGFSGLPVYAGYVENLNAYLAFLQSGGLPADYTAIDQATIQSYLAALNAAGGLAAYGSLDAFFVGYFAFVAAGNDPATFAGLPAYTDYVAALNAYYAFIADGGTPSEYTVLTQAQIEAYLTALANTAGGGFANFAALNDFFVQFFAYLGEGGDPDRFAGLPGRGNGGGGDEPSPRLGSVRGWQFASDALRVARVDAKITAEGRITEMTVYNPSGVTTDYTNRTSDLREFGRFGDAVAWTRYYVGSANRQQNVSEHLMVGTPAFEVPTAGLIDYALVGGTAPTNRNAAPGSTGWFTGDLAVAFGSTAPRVGFNFDLYTEGTGYRVQTAGGAKGAATGGLGVSGEGVFETQSLGLEVIAGTGCTGYCIGQVFGGLFGKGASHAGFTYNIFDRNQNNAVQGVAIFGRSGEAIAGLGDPDQKSPNPGDPGDAETFTGNQSLATVGDKGGLVFTDIAVAYDGQSIPVGYRTASEEVGKGDTTLFETGNSDGVVRWARWADGTPVYEERAANVSDFSAVGKDGGYHFVAGAPLANIPASGTVSYEIAGFTRPTRRDESTSTGTVTGSAAVVFGTVPKVALDLDITSGSDVFDLYTAGRLTDPTQSALRVKSGGEFFTSAPLDQNPDRGAVSVDGPASFCGTACRGDVWGFLAGDGATHMGLTYRITDALRRERVEGSVAFKQGGDGNSGAVGMQVSDLGGGISTTALGVGIFPAETATASMEPAAVSRAKMAMPDTTISLSGVPAAPPTIAVAPDWGRWTVPSDALSARTMAIDTGTDTMPIAAGSMPNPRGLLGGLVTFAEVH